MRRREILRLLALGPALVAAGGVAAPRARAAGKVALQLVQVLATGPLSEAEAAKAEKRFDPSLGGLKSVLERYPFRSFERKSSERREAAAGGGVSFPLWGETEVTITFRLELPDAEHVELEILMAGAKGKELLRSKVKLKDGGSAIVTKEQDQGARLFLCYTVKRS